ncbi:MAG: UDP-N-acetylmuramoylalanine/D-glutamate ligase [Dehalococcoidia bacterium]|nr:UDP-N-acetylmuramoylalanine/D-glutamate ligase [Dehalococcoidia bacterium]
MELRGKKVTVVGLGIEGRALVRYLVGLGAQVTVSDARTPEALSESLRQVHDLPIKLSLGSNRAEDTVNADAIFISQGIPLDIPALVAAREKLQGAPGKPPLPLSRARSCGRQGYPFTWGGI